VNSDFQLAGFPHATSFFSSAGFSSFGGSSFGVAGFDVPST